MDFLLREHVLDMQICSVCKQYLSHGPTKVYFDGGTKCGRCNKGTDGGVTSFLNKISKNFIFPCVNRFEGCDQLLKFQDIPEHERSCTGALYQCPLCPEDKYLPNSLLYLVNHYKIFHNKYYRIEPSFLINADSPEDNFYLYCDKSENILIIIFVQFNGSQLCINASTVGTRVDKLKYRVKLYENVSQKYESVVRSCPAFGKSFDSIEINSNLILQTSSAILCVLELYTLEALNIALLLDKLKEPIQKSISNQVTHKLKEKVEKPKSIIINEQKTKKTCPEDYGKLSDIFAECNFVKKMPDIYLTEDFKCTFGTVYKKPISAIQGDFSVLASNWPNNVTNTLCKFCENYYSTSGDYQEIYFCVHLTLCGSCYNNGGICQHCTYLSISSSTKHYKLLYYCRYGCKQFFKGGLLSVHERHCVLNAQASLSDSEFAKYHFEAYFVETCKGNKSVIVRRNVVVFDRNSFGDRGQIYMVTDYKFQCIIMYKTNYETKRTFFWVLHRYSPEKCYILFKIVQNNTYSEQPNSFYIDLYTDKVFFVAVVRKL